MNPRSFALRDGRYQMITGTINITEAAVLPWGTPDTWIKEEISG